MTISIMFKAGFVAASILEKEIIVVIIIIREEGKEITPIK